MKIEQSEVFFCTCFNAFSGSTCLLAIPPNSAQSEEERLEMEEYSDVKWKNWAKVKEQLLVKCEWAACRPICDNFGSNFWEKMHQ